MDESVAYLSLFSFFFFFFFDLSLVKIYSGAHCIMANNAG